MTTAIVELDASHPSGFSDHNPINLKTNVQWTADSAVRTTHNGVAAWDLNAAALEAPATDRHLLCPAAPYGYTTATWVDWRDSDSGWRTLHRADTGGHLIIVENGNKNLGVYSNYNGGFRDSGVRHQHERLAAGGVRVGGRRRRGRWRCGWHDAPVRGHGTELANAGRHERPRSRVRAQHIQGWLGH